MDTDVTDSSTVENRIDERKYRRQVVELAPIPTFEDLSTPAVVAADDDDDIVRIMITVFSHDPVDMSVLETNQIIIRDEQMKRGHFTSGKKTRALLCCVERLFHLYGCRVISGSFLAREILKKINDTRANAFNERSKTKESPPSWEFRRSGVNSQTFDSQDVEPILYCCFVDWYNYVRVKMESKPKHEFQVVHVM